jgi:hypothetical protein
VADVALAWAKECLSSGRGRSNFNSSSERSSAYLASARAKSSWTTSCAAPSSLVTPWGAALVYGVRDALSPGNDRLRQSFL